MSRSTAVSRLTLITGTAAAVVAVASLTAMLVRPDPRDVIIGAAGAAFTVGLGVGMILVVALPIGWIVFLWRRTARHRGRFVVLLAFTIAAIAVVAALLVFVVPLSPSHTAAPEA